MRCIPDDRATPEERSRRPWLLGALGTAALLVAAIAADVAVQADTPPPSQSPPGGGTDAAARTDVADQDRHLAANRLVLQLLERLALGPAIEAKLRQRVWAGDRELVGVGFLEHAGEGTGRVRMELQVPIADGKSRLLQTCDGRLAWWREEAGQEVLVRRVDVGRLDEYFVPRPGADPVRPRLRVGGLVELLDRIQADYRLSLFRGSLSGEPMWMLRGTMREEVEAELLSLSKEDDWPALCPREVNIAVPVEGAAAHVPCQIEYWSATSGTERRLISLLEIYDVTTVATRPAEHFRFDVGDADFVNDTDRYLDRLVTRLAQARRGE